MSKYYSFIRQKILAERTKPRSFQSFDDVRYLEATLLCGWKTHILVWNIQLLLKLLQSQGKVEFENETSAFSLCEEPVNLSCVFVKIMALHLELLSVKRSVWRMALEKGLLSSEYGGYCYLKWLHGQIHTDGFNPWDTTQALCKSCLFTTCIKNVFLYIQKQCFFVKLFLSLHYLYYVVFLIRVAFLFNF